MPLRQRGGALFLTSLHLFSNMSNKPSLRQQALTSRRGLSQNQRLEKSLAIQIRLMNFLADNDGISNILLYRSLADEVDTLTLFQQISQTIFSPATHISGHMKWHEAGPETLWKKGDFGVEEPETGRLWAPDCGPTMLICPLAGFDRQGNRLGMGRGCFDRWLEHSGSHLHSIAGLAFSCQEVVEISSDEHDIPMQIIFTESEAIQCLK